MAAQPPQPDNKDVYDAEKSSLGLGENTSGSGGGSLAGKVDELIGQHQNKDAGQAESNSLQSLNEGITGIGAKLGKGFTGAAGGAGGAAGAAGTLYKSDNAFAGAGGKLKLIGAVAQSAAKNRKGLIAGVGGGSLVTLLGALLIGSLPFGFNSIMENVIQKEMKVVSSNVSEMQDNLASYYIKKYLLPGMRINHCAGTIVDRSCAVTAQGDGPVMRLFRAWQKGNIEAKWAKQGFEIRYDRSANRYFIRATGMGDIDISRYTGTNDNLFHEVNRRDVRALFQDSHRNSSKWDRMLTRFGWGKITLRNNFRATRCNFTCKVLDVKDKYFTEPLLVKKKAFKIKLFQVVLSPMSEMYSLAFTCLMAGHDCDPSKPVVDEETGEYRNQFDRDIGTRMDAIRAQVGGDIRLARAETAVKELREKGITRYLIETLIKTILGKAGASEAVKAGTAKVAGYAVPVLGTAIAVAGIISVLSSIGPILKVTNASIQSHGAALQFALNSSYKDEIQSGNVDAAMVDSFNQSFSKNQEVQDDGKTMGGAAAGAVPLYNAVVNEGGQTQTAFLNGLFGAKTYAAANDPTHTAAYKCPVSGKTLDPSGKDGQLICPEQSLKYANYIAGAFGSISNFLNLPGISVITAASNFITGVIGDAIGAITGPIVDLIQKAPGYQSMVDSVTAAMEPILGSLVKLVFPNWINDNQSGATNFVATDMGARVTANDYAQNVLRGQPLTPEEQFAIESDANALDEIEFKHKSLYARMFDKEDTHSFVTRLSLAMPTDFRSNVGSIFTGLISDPFGKLMRGFGAIFSGQKAFAAPKILADPFGLTHYGFPLNNPVFSEDPDANYNTHCNDNNHSTEWNKHAYVNPDTGMTEHQQPDMCGIINQAIGAGGGLYDSSLVGL